MTGDSNDSPDWTTWTAPRTRVKAWALDDHAPRSVDGIAAETHVEPDHVREVLDDLILDGVVHRVERDGVVRFGPDRDHMRRKAGEIKREADNQRELLDIRGELTEMLNETENPAHERLIEHKLDILHIALMSGEESINST